MPRIVGDILIDRPVEDVFDFVADERNEPTYNRTMLRSQMLTTAFVGVGSGFAATHRGRRRPVEMLQRACWQHLTARMESREAK